MQSPSSTIMAALVWHIKPNNLNFPAKFSEKKSFFEGKNFFFFFIWIIISRQENLNFPAKFQEKKLKRLLMLLMMNLNNDAFLNFKI